MKERAEWLLRLRSLTDGSAQKMFILTLRTLPHRPRVRRLALSAPLLASAPFMLLLLCCNAADGYPALLDAAVTGSPLIQLMIGMAQRAPSDSLDGACAAVE